MPPTKTSDFENGDHVKKCPICSKSFGLTHWRHHCHWCGDVVCDSCSGSRLPLPPMYPDAVRVCDLCKVEAAGAAAKTAPRKLGTAGTTAVSSGGTLGSSSEAAGGTSGTYDEERAKRAAAVEARMKANTRPSASAAANAKKDPEELEKQRQRELRQRIMEKDMAIEQRERKEKEQKQLEEALKAQQQRTQSEAEYPPTPPPSTSDLAQEGLTEPSAAVLEQEVSGNRGPQAGSNPMLEAALRRQAASAAKGGKSSAPTTVDPERTQLLSRITQMLSAQRKEEPFGLRSMDASKLRMYLRHLEGDS